MDKKTALEIIVAYACCVSDFSMCGKCPWNHTDDCRDTNFSDVIEEAVDTILEEEKWWKWSCQKLKLVMLLQEMFEKPTPLGVGWIA